MMLPYFWAVAVGAVALAVGYALGRRHEREAQAEARSHEAALDERDSGRTPGLPTNHDSPPSEVRSPRWTK